MIQWTRYLRTLLITSLLWSVSSTGGWAASPEPIDPSGKAAFEQLIKEYLFAHPEVIEEAMQKLEERRQDEARRRGREAVAAHQQELLQDPESPVHGNPSGDVTVVEFFDYRCRYCRAMAPAIIQLLKDDPNVRLIYKDFPILGDASVMASKIALASRSQGKYPALHEALMDAKGELSQAVVMDIAAHVGLDTEKLAGEMENPAIAAAIEKNRELAKTLGLSGTPAFIIGQELAPGAMEYQELLQLVARARAK